MINNFKKNSHINDKLSSKFHRILTNIFIFMTNKNYKYINISRIKLQKNLENVTIFYTTLNDEFNEKNSLLFLNSQLSIIKKKLSKKWNHRKLPKLLFKYDKKLLEFEKVTIILEKNKS